MGLLDIYKETFDNPEPLTKEYLTDRNEGDFSGRSNFWQYCSNSKYTYRTGLYWSGEIESKQCEVRAMRLTFTYDFKSQALQYELEQGNNNVLYMSGLQHPIMMRLYKAIDGEMSKRYENVKTINSFETLMYGLQAQLKEHGFHFSLQK